MILFRLYLLTLQKTSYTTMIADIKIKNILSFRDEASFSFEADKSKDLESYHVVEIAPDVRLLKLGVIYGANASGKSNFIKAYSYMTDFLEKVPTSKADKTGVSPFLLDESSRNAPSSFGITFYSKMNDVYTKFVYSISLTNDNVVSENLAYYPSQQPAMIFERGIENGVSTIKFGNKIKLSNVAKEEITLRCLPNMSLFAAYMQLNVNVVEMECALSFFKPQEVHTSEILSYYGWSSILSDDTEDLQYALNYMKTADFNVSEITRDSKNDIIFKHITKGEDGVERVYELPIDSESRGTIRTLDIAKYVQEVISNNTFFAIDEIESSLHPKLVEYIVERFLQESEYAQMLVTTHYDGLLAQDDLLRKDNIWFTEKGEDGASTIYPLTDFKALNRLSSLQKAYKFGKFGAIPNI